MDRLRLKQFFKRKITNNEALSIKETRELCDLLGIDCDVITYSKFKSVGPFRDKIVLIQREDDDGDLLKVGHFCVLYLDGEKKHYNLFDSCCGEKDYKEGGPLYIFKKYLSTQTADDMVNEIVKFTKDNKFVFNDHKMQRNDSNLCAFWCIWRLINKDLSQDLFFKYNIKLSRKMKIKTLEEVMKRAMMMMIDAC